MLLQIASACGALWVDSSGIEKGGSKPQWEAEKPVVHHYTGDYDRCKECYYNLHNKPPAPPTNEDPATGATAKSALRGHASAGNALRHGADRVHGEVD